SLRRAWPVSSRLSWRPFSPSSLQPFSLPVDGMGEDLPRENGRFSYENRPPSRAKSIILGAGCNREFSRFPSENPNFSEGKRSLETLTQPVGDRSQHLGAHVQRRQSRIAQRAARVGECPARVGEKQVIRRRKHAHRDVAIPA